ncbi:MAG: TM2 domain-containing protein [SAR324 cluster bacterium]|nr:TM2 domain-containing protein [SAR324 cluster bacterium]
MKVFSDQWPYLLPGVERSVVGAYIFSVLWGLPGVHRFYLGKVRSLLTGGLFGAGWLYNLLTLPRQVRQFDLRCQALRAAHDARPGRRDTHSPLKARSIGKSRQGDTMVALLDTAAANCGLLTVTKGVLATGLLFQKVDAALREMMVARYVDVRNHLQTGVVQYVFPEPMHDAPKGAGSR